VSAAVNPLKLMRRRFVLLTVMAAGLLAAHATAADSPGEKTRKLIEVLQSNSPFYDKARACQQLGECGQREAVPALAALLADEHLSAYARSGLEGIPDPSAAEALRAAAAALHGNLLAGVIDSLGVLRDAQAVGLLRKLAEDPAAGVSQAAWLALGRIATDESVRILQQTLAQGAATNRAGAAAACLLAAEQQLAEGRAGPATALYDAVRQADVPPVLRAGATRGAIVTRKIEGVRLLIEQLRSKDRLLRNAALFAIREIPSDTLANALNAELSCAVPELQFQLLAALADCHNAQSLQVLQAKTASDDAEVRKTALRVLGQIGGTAEAGVFLQAVADNRSVEESALAMNYLGQMKGAAVDEQIVKTMVSATDAGVRVQLIRLLERRRTLNVTGALLKQAADPDAKVSVAALRALQFLAGPRELSALIGLTKAGRDEAVREAAAQAVLGACTRTDATAPGGAVVLAELQQTTDPALKNAWIRILVSLGYAKALPAILATLHDTQEAVAVNTLAHLARWPDPSPIDELLSVVQTGATPALRQHALRSAIQLATTAADAHQSPDETVAGWFQRASPAAQTPAERRLLISGLGRLQTLASFRLVAPYLEDPDVQNEAAMAIVQMAPALKPDDSAALQEALAKIAARVKNADIRNAALKLTGPSAHQSQQTSLFDGRSLAGWEGNPKVWRVRDGVIVGGSLQGNPRNEFLATARNFTNFVLRVEYKLVGTAGFVNGGVQFRSVRVPRPPNEMSGFQADIGAGHSGCLYDESRRNKFLARATDEQIKRLEKAGDWNRYEVRCVGPRIQIRLNGAPTVDYTETDPALPQHGLIALQIHGGCKAEISFRNLTIEDLAQP